MANIIVEAVKYLIILCFAFYTYECFASLRGTVSTVKKNRIFIRQRIFLFLIHFGAFLALYVTTEEISILFFYLFQVVFFSMLLTCYQLFYENCSMLLVNNMCMLLAIGFIMLTRLSFQRAVKQYIIALVTAGLTLLIPLIVQKMTWLKKFGWVFALFGICALLVVTVFGSTTYGAKISISIAGFSVQPSEFVKILFVFFTACMLWQSTDFLRVAVTTAIAAAHVLILVASKDLGGALIFFITYLIMLYVATRKLFYLAAGLLSGCVAAIASYGLFSHIRVRVLAWSDPLSVIDNEGYQISQSLFAIGTGGWFGMGLNQGTPNRIPIVEQDFIFSAISEEMGGVFALCLIMVCVSCFLMFLNIAMQMRDQFYKLAALGLGILYGFQIFLTIGGAIKMIPSTGVTLPLVSYGGSSLLSTMIIFAVIQGFYMLKQKEGELNGAKGNGQERFSEKESFQEK